MKDKKISLKDKKRIPPSKARKHASHRSEIRPSLSPNISSNFHNTWYKIIRSSISSVGLERSANNTKVNSSILLLSIVIIFLLF